MNDTKIYSIKVSVIVPFFNVAKFLPQCLDTILYQSHENLDIILVDDGSTDGSSDIADSYSKKDNRIQVIHQENAGVSSARNTGIDVAVGEYICFVDGDDFLMEDYVEYLLAMVLEYNADVAVTTRMLSTFDDDLQDMRRTENGGTPRVLTGEYAAAAIMYYHIPIGCYCKIFKRAFLGKDLRFFPNVFVGEGFNFNAKAFQMANKVVVGNKKIYCYRRDNPISCMTMFKLSKYNMALDAIQLMRETLLVRSKMLYKACDYADWHTHGDMYNWMVLAKVQNQYPQEYMQCYRKVRNYAFRAIFAPVNKKERIRAIVQFVHPRLLALLLEYRRWKAQRRDRNKL